MKLQMALAVATVFLCLGCVTVGARTKAELIAQITSDTVVTGNYRKMAKYWDMHATKAVLDAKPITHLDLVDSEGRAEISIGSGPYYGMIELLRVDEGHTRMRTYERGYYGKTIREWKQLILQSPER